MYTIYEPMGRAIGSTDMAKSTQQRKDEAREVAEPAEGRHGAVRQARRRERKREARALPLRDAATRVTAVIEPRVTTPYALRSRYGASLEFTRQQRSSRHGDAAAP